MATVSQDDIINLARSYGIPPEIALAIYRQESSSGANTSTSGKGAVGPMQLMPATFKAMDVGDDINDPYQNVEAGIKYASQAYRATGGDPAATAMYYHAGPGFKKKLEQNPDLGDGGIRTVDYGQQVAARVKGATMDADRQVDSSGVSSVTNGPAAFGGATPTLGGGTTPPTTRHGGDLEDLLNQTTDLTSSLIQSSADLGDQLKENLKSQMASIKTQGDLAATVSLEKFHQDSKKASDNAAELSRLGINTSDTDSIIAQLSTQLASEYKESQALRASIDERQTAGGSFFNILDPVGSIMGELQLHDDIQKHNRIVAAMDSQKNYVDRATSIAANISAVNAAKYTSTTAQGEAAAADLLRQQATERSLAAQDKLMRVDVDTQVRTLTAVSHEISTINQVDQSETNREIKRTLEQQKADTLRKKAKEDERVQIAGKVLGLKINSVEELQHQPPEVKNAVERITIAGEDGQIANSPLEAAQILSRGNLNAMAPNMATNARMLIAAAQKARQQVDSDPLTKSLGKAQREEAINKKMVEAFGEYASTPGKVMVRGVDGKEQNPFLVPEYGVMQKDANAANLKLTKILADTKGVMPTLNLDDKMITELAYANIGPGKAYKDIGEAAQDLTKYYRAGVISNNNKYRLDALGLPTQAEYLVNGRNMLDYKAVMQMMLDKERAQGANSFSVEELRGKDNINPGVNALRRGSI